MSQLEICRWTAIETAQKISKRDVSVREVTKAHLDRADALNGELNALTELLGETALAQADELDRKGQPQGVLHGLPVTIKCNIDQKGTVNSNGLPAMRNNVASEDSPVVANMRRDGAVFIGRTNTPEFSLRWFTSNPLHGVTHNPWNKALTPGGSSGGASATIAAGIGVIAHGNDLGGSLRYPAYCCGVTSIRPSLGTIASFNPSGKKARAPMTQQMSVQGPIARSVADLRLALSSMRSRDSRDGLWSNAASSGRERSSRKLRIGYVVHAFGEEDHREVNRAMEIACAGLRSAGHLVEECTPPEMTKAAEAWGLLLNTETEILNGADMATIGSAEVNRAFEGYKAFFGTTDLEGFLVAMTERLRLMASWSQFFDRHDLVVMPTSGSLPFINDLDFLHPDRIPEMLKAQRYLFVVNMLGLPSVAVPTHVADGENGRSPTGVQLVGPQHDDDFCLDVAESLEREIGRPIETLRLP
ncbi:MAG: amidase [Rhizobiaceae bacterium]